jgi:hypothetical protein
MPIHSSTQQIGNVSKAVAEGPGKKDSNSSETYDVMAFVTCSPFSVLLLTF